MSRDGAKRVYVPLSTDLLHERNMDLIVEARKLGDITIGLLTDRAIASSHRQLPLLTWAQRKRVIENIIGVTEVVPQDTLDYDTNLRKFRPDFVIHGDDWQVGGERAIKEKAIATLKEWGGVLVAPTDRKEPASSHLADEGLDRGITPETRMRRLRRLLDAKAIVRILEVHNGLSGIIAERAKATFKNQPREFDGMWLSSLTHSASKGKPDIEYVDITSTAQTISEVFEVATKPMIVDGDSGGPSEHFAFMVRTLERLGVSAVIIEDKIGVKRNSLFGTDVDQTQDSIENFCEKIKIGKKAQVTPEFMIIARIESLILKKGQADALTRAGAYTEAGADGIMIHSKETSPQEILDFCRQYRDYAPHMPIVVVPSTFAIITEEELIKAGVRVVIYANHLLRSAHPAMMKTAESILRHGRCFEAEEHCMPIKDIINLIPVG